MATTPTRWNPFKPLNRFDPLNFDDVFRGLGARSLLREFDNTPEMRIDVTEDDKAFTVRADLPGVDKDAIDIAVEGNQVSINAELKAETRREEERQIYTERYAGTIYRSFTLPADVDDAKAQARYEGGVLTLTLPKKANGGMRRITVS